MNMTSTSSEPAWSASPQAEQETKKRAHPSGAATLLLVDDETSVLSSLRRLFRLNGYAIEQASSGAEGLRILEEKPIDLVISDMRMPEMDGATFLQQVRERRPDVVRLLLTGYADISSTVSAINRGEIFRYITKPWCDEDLLVVVREALRRRELERENVALLELTQRQNAELLDLNETLEARVASRTAELDQINRMLEKSFEQVNTSFTMAITVFSGMLEMRQGQMAGHARRVSHVAGRMATRMGLSSTAVQDVELAALLHDLGELGFPDEMLRKPTSMYTPAELTRYMRHPIDGEAALMSMDRLRNASTIVRQHHERMDGRGFPDQLSGDAIVLGARIVAVASEHDGLRAGSLSEKASSAEQARRLIEQGIGSRYDPAVVATLFAVLEDIEAEAATEVELDLRELKPYMVLSRDLQTSKGAILLPMGFQFDAAMIKRVLALAQRFEARLKVHVLLRSAGHAASQSGSAVVRSQVRGAAEVAQQVRP